MTDPKFYMLLIAALFPLIIGMIWYNPKVFGNAWMKASGVTMPEKPDRSQMWKIYIQVYIFSLLYSWIIANFCIHQFGAFGMIGGDIPNAKESYKLFMGDYGNAFRTFGHGALHGGVYSLMTALFMVGIPALFEQRGWNYILIHVGYFGLCGLLMGAFLCAYM